MTDISKGAVDVAANVLRLRDAHHIASMLTALRAALDAAETRAVKAEAERDAANALLREARVDLEAYVEAEWPKDQRKQYPSYQRKYDRDMELCRRIDAHLGAKP